jgi:hypothetical protein
MPEMPICIHCRKPINKHVDDYVVTNKDTEKYEDQWKYAHAKCQNDNA